VKIYSLTELGKELAKTTTGNINNRWRIIYFMGRHNGRASDDQLSEYLGIPRASLYTEIGPLLRGESPAVRVVSG
jgi:hypothetical protein